jgi:hypothetical protein
MGDEESRRAKVEGRKHMRSIIALLVLVLLVAAAQRLPAPIIEAPGPKPTTTAKPQPKPAAKPKPTPQAGNAQMGIWKLNEAESKLAPGTAKNNNVVCRAAGGSVRITVDGTDGEGKPLHNEWTGKFDGKDYLVTGDPTSDSRSYNEVEGRTLILTVKKNGKVTATGRVVVSADGKRRTVTTGGTSKIGKNFLNTAVYNKQ